MKMVLSLSRDEMEDLSERGEHRPSLGNLLHPDLANVNVFNRENMSTIQSASVGDSDRSLDDGLRPTMNVNARKADILPVA